ncbi:MAG: hypothetical protein ABIG66_00385 [Candidatus Kerfeldbacteria bacterium]
MDEKEEREMKKFTSALALAALILMMVVPAIADARPRHGRPRHTTHVVVVHRSHPRPAYPRYDYHPWGNQAGPVYTTGDQRGVDANWCPVYAPSSVSVCGRSIDQNATREWERRTGRR